MAILINSNYEVFSEIAQTLRLFQNSDQSIPGENLDDIMT